ncbi:MAG: terminase small subunit [Bryobacteraceae bacterium]
MARGKTNRQAALAAGYSPRSAGCSGSQLIRQSHVAQRIQELRSAGALHSPPCITPEIVLAQLTEAFSADVPR